MAEQTILSVAEDVAKRQRDADELREFLNQWTPDSMPFCPTGMRLLLDMAKRQPTLYQHARRRSFADIGRVVYGLTTSVGRHVATCAACNESRPLNYQED